MFVDSLVPGALDETMDFLDNEDRETTPKPRSSRRSLTDDEVKRLLPALDHALNRCGRLGNFSVKAGTVVLTSPRGRHEEELPLWAYTVLRLSDEELRAAALAFVRPLVAHLGQSSRPPREEFHVMPVALSLGVVITLGLLAWYLFGSSGAPAVETSRPSPNKTAAPPPTLSCAELRSLVASGADLTPEKTRTLETELLLVQLGAGDPIDASEAFRLHFPGTSQSLSLRAWGADATLAKAKSERGIWKAKSQSARTLLVKWPSGTYDTLLKDPSLASKLEPALSELGVTFGILRTRCSGDAYPLHHLWLYADTPPHLVATAVLQVDALDPSPWTAEPFLHPPSESGLNPLYALLEATERANHEKLETSHNLFGDNLPVERHALSVTLKALDKRPQELQKQVRALVVRLGLGKPR